MEKTVESFWIDRTEVTVAAYSRCVAAGGCKKPSGAGKICNYKNAAKGDHPINCVTQDDAVSYCSWAGKRLPADLEWEYAALGGKEPRQFPWGNESPLCVVKTAGAKGTGGAARNWLCWDGKEIPCDDLPSPANYTGGTCPVGAFPRGDSHWGAADMAGNVWEWLPATGENGGQPMAAICGGGWRAAYPLDDLRFNGFNITVCMPVSTKFTSEDVGFRCAMDWEAGKAK